MIKAKIAVYPGTFDPVTYGHIDLVKRASRIFDKVIVAVAHNRPKGTFFSVRERIDMLKDAVKGIENIEIDDFDGLVVNYVKKQGSCVMIRGLRMLTDFEYEFQMALTNRKFAGDIETIFMMPHEQYSYISSKLIKEAAALGADLTSFIPKACAVALKKKIKK
ncbi:MAG: pantetheine-phosphate adenylyltransferase [Candidatus Omnitrophica bacterium]|nr:pantetheine-phosphate adenylyltransferase [Candidatus Omnitrophota bacterium]MBU0895873.1 pantetheine-phosphate adenylyltransferase [Candidatus Omnitrophota bacterium]MBU1038129.1 pantetheine-phosphate adenylyltransferase [Candidatus Omnitrophota bacterium]MBU1808873.1 pantetheine-phosphate adenylyltransferase [Candidatus Omnitrophota bacterium]